MIKSISFFAFILSALISGCSKLENPENVKATDKIQIYTDKDTLIPKADTIAIAAKIPIEANVMDITFTATAGTFPASASKTIKQLSDSFGVDGRYAKVIYVADTTATTVYITAEGTNARTRKILIIKK
jgi:hypothetical protein